jgi:hypothetical protein
VAAVFHLLLQRNSKQILAFLGYMAAMKNIRQLHPRLPNPIANVPVKQNKLSVDNLSSSTVDKKGLKQSTYKRFKFFSLTLGL